jgi:hypothetical protein
VDLVCYHLFWRNKSIDLLYKRQIFLCRLDKFLKDDPWEGAWTDFCIENNLWNRNSLEGEDGLINEIKRWHFISCWHLSDHESMAMWKIYSSEQAGIAIKTSIKKFKDSLLDEKQQIYIGKVEYIENHDVHKENYDITGDWAGLSQICLKRQCFKYEQEVRIIERDMEGKKEHSFIDIDLNFIDKVRLSPLFNDAFIESIKDISSKYGLDESLIEKSSLYSK